MKIFFDPGTPGPLRHFLIGHDIETAYERGWSQLENGALIAAIDTAEFDVFVTTDQNLKHQQNLSSRKVAIVVILTSNWPRIRVDLQPVRAAISSATPGSYIEVNVSVAGSN